MTRACCIKSCFCHGGMRGFSGQLVTYVPNQGPCYRCIFEDIQPADDYMSCSQAGGIGMLPGIIGTLQALEAQKYITGAGEFLTGRILIFDGLIMKFREVKLPKENKSCRVCGENADIVELQSNILKMLSAT